MRLTTKDEGRSLPAVRSVERAVKILEALAAEPLRLIDVASRLGLHKATASRLLACLARVELVTREGDHRYALGPGVLRLAAGQLAGRTKLLDVLRDPLARIAAITGETVTVHVRLGTGRLCVEELESRQPIAYRAGVGQVAPLHVGSAGKVLLAFLPDAERAAVLGELRLVRLTDRTITGLSRLEAELARVRRAGYAFSAGERVTGAAAVSVPVLNGADRVVAAVSVLAPDERMGPREQVSWSAALRREVPRVPAAASPPAWALAAGPR